MKQPTEDRISKTIYIWKNSKWEYDFSEYWWHDNDVIEWTLTRITKLDAQELVTAKKEQIQKILSKYL